MQMPAYFFNLVEQLKRRTLKPRHGRSRCKAGSRNLRFETLEERRLLAVDLLGEVNWVAAGPSPIINGQTENVASTGPGPNAVSGAIHSVATHPTNADIIFIGAVNGGVWRTTNATNANPIWTPLTDQFAGTAIAALAYDPTDAGNNTLLAGVGRFSSFGNEGGLRTGILRTTDGGNTFVALGAADLSGRNISAVAPRGSTILVAANGDGTGPGVYRSTDTGNSFTNISGTNGLGAGAAADIASDPSNVNRLYVSVLGVGIFRTNDLGGAGGWTNVSSGDAALNAAITGGGNTNLELSVASNGRIYAGVIRNGQLNYIGFSDNQGGTWTQMDLPISLEGPRAITGASNANPIVITSTAHGLDPNLPHIVRIAGVTGNTAANGDFRVVVIDANTFSLQDLNGNNVAGNGAYVADGGDTWRELNPLQPREKPGSQGARHFSILADPNNANIVYIGGDRQDDPDGWPNSIGANDFSGRLFRGDTTVAAVAPGSLTNAFSPQWEHLTHTQNLGFAGGGTPADGAPHADSRDMTIDAMGRLIEVDDGGVYRRNSPTDNTGNWISLMSNAAGGLQVTEQHDIAYDNNSNIIFSGNQDTGTGQQTATGSLEWTSMRRNVAGTAFYTGDGGDVVVDNLVGGGNSLRYASFNELSGLQRLTFNAANVLTAVATPTLTLAGTGPVAQVAPGFQFVTPLAVNEVVANRLIIGGNNGVYESTDNGDNITRISTGAVNRNAIAYGGRQNNVANNDVLYVGSGTQVFARTATTFGAITATALTGAGTINDVEMDPDDWARVFAIDNNQVFFSSDAGANWNDITGNLTDTNFRTLEYVPGAGGNDVLLVGGNLGVFRMFLSNQGVWTELGVNLPNAPVWDMDYDAPGGTGDDLLVVGTLGRGAFTVANASTAITQAPILNICGDEDFPNQDDTFLLIRDPNNPLLLQVFVNNVLQFTGPLSAIQQINVFGAGGNDELIVDSSNGLINVPDGIRFDGDHPCPDEYDTAGFGGFDRLTLRQTGGSAAGVSDVLAIGATPGSGRSTITSSAGTQRVDFQFLEPVVDNVAAATFSITGLPGIASLLQDANQINYGTGQIMAATWGRITVDNFEPIEFINKTNLVIDAGAGSDEINLNYQNVAQGAPTGLTGNITVNGGDPTASDRLILNTRATVQDRLELAPTGQGAGTVESSGSGLPTTVFTGIEDLTFVMQSTEFDEAFFDGTAGNDQWEFTPGITSDTVTVSGTMDAGGAASGPFAMVPTTLVGLALNPALSFVVEINAGVTGPGGDGGNDSLIFNGTAGNDAIRVSQIGASQVFIQNTINNLLFSNLHFINNGGETVTVRGHDGDDAFSHGPGVSAPIFYEGGTPDSGSDVLNFAAAGNVTVELANSEIEDAGTGATPDADFSGIEVVNIDANSFNVTIEGTANDDEFRVRPLTANAVQTTVAGQPLFVSTEVATFTIDGGAAAADDVADHVIVEGTNNRDVFTIDSATRTVAVQNAAGTNLEPIVLAADVEAVTGEGKLGNDTFVVIPAAAVGAGLNIAIDGGLPGASDTLVVGSNATGAALPATDFAVVALGLNPGEGRIRVFRNAAALPDIAYQGVELVLPNVASDVNGNPQRMIFGPDPTEVNDTRNNATFVGSGATLNLDNLSIFSATTENFPAFLPLADQDWFRFDAAETGTLDFQVFFNLVSATLLPGGGDLNIAVRDSNGDLIGSGTALLDGAGNTIGERIAIPVVRNQTYYLSVFGATSAAANAYELTAINVPAPVPQTIDLQGPSDSGRNDSDDITRVPTATFDIVLDDNRIDEFANLNLVPDTTNDDAQTTGADYGVEVFNNGASIGFAFYTGTGNLWRFTATAGDLNEGHNNFITAATWIRDRANPAIIGTSDQQGPINALQVTLDTIAPPRSFGVPAVADDGLHPDSDSGIPDQPNLSVDRITSDTTPTFWGRAEANSMIRAYVVANDNGTADPADDTLVEIGRAVAIPLDGDEALADGAWELTSTIDMNDPNIFAALPHDGLRTIRITAEDEAGNVSTAAELQIFIDTRGPQVDGVFITDERDYDLFDPKPTEDGPTPNITSIDIDFIDRPPRGEAGTTTSNAVDVLLLFDDTGSFAGTAPTLTGAFPTIIANLQAALPGADLAFGVARFEEYANFASESPTGRPFTLNQPILNVNDPQFAAAIAAALNRTAPGFGGDSPESAIEALFQVATGAGFDGNGNASTTESGAAGLVNTQTNPGGSGDVPTFASFTADGSGPVVASSGSLGGVGFRAGARKLILLATDIGFAYEPETSGATEFVGLDGVTVPIGDVQSGGRNSTPGGRGAMIQETIDALLALDGGNGALVIGLSNSTTAGVSPRLPLEALSLLTGAINETASPIDSGIAGDPIDPGEPFFFFINTSSGDAVADAITAAVTGAAGSSGFLYPAVNEQLSTTPGNYRLVGDANGIIAIKSIEFIDNTVPGEIGKTTIRLHFFAPLPDDRYTLTIVDDIQDDAGNALDGQSNASEPQEVPTFPSGDGNPGGDFVARFTVDSRPELGTWSGGSAWVDTNGNLYFDPENPDTVNEDIVYSFGFASDDVFAGNFAQVGQPADGFDKLAAYGRGVDGLFRWLIDTDNNGASDLAVPQGVPTIGGTVQNINAHPVAGNFNVGNAAVPNDPGLLDGDEVGLFNGTTWLLDMASKNYSVDTAIAFRTADGKFVGGLPVVGDFDGDGYDDLATWRDDVFYFDLTSENLAAGKPRYDGIVDAFFRFGFIGIREQPVAADFNNDGIDDIGLWVPDRSGVAPGEGAEWYILVSGGDKFGEGIDNNTPDGKPDTVLDRRVTAGPGDAVPDDVFGVAPPVVKFTPEPFGNDIYAIVGDEFAMPLVGNFDPPVTLAADPPPVPQPVSIAGTGVDDEILVELGASYRVVVNGVERVMNPALVSEILIDGGAGRDSIRVVDQLGAADAHLKPGRLEFRNADLQVIVTAVESIVVAGNADDRAYFYDSSGNDVFVSRPTFAEMRSTAFANRATGFGQYHASATAGGTNNRASIYESSLDDSFVYDGNDNRASLTNANYAVYVNSFTRTNAYAAAGADSDRATLYDSQSNDRFTYYAATNDARLTGPNVYGRAVGFDEVVTHATAGGADSAQFHDSAGDDLFAYHGATNEARLTGAGFDVTARLYEVNRAFAKNGGNDSADFYDSAGNDYFLLDTEKRYAKMSGTGLNASATSFDRHSAYARNGGVNDRAEIIGVLATDAVFGRGESFLLSGIDHYLSAFAFDRVTARARKSNRPEADVVNVDYVFAKIGEWL